MSISHPFFDDPRVTAARELLIAALSDHAQSITSIRSADPSKSAVSQSVIASFEAARGGALYYPYISTGIGNGAWVELIDGSVKLDFINGIGAHFGHSLPGLMSATLTGCLSDTVMQGNLQQSSDSVTLIQLLTEVSGMDHAFLTTSGAMAVENALKLSFQAKAPRRRILAFEGCFAGRTLALASVTDKAAYRDGLPGVLAVDYVPFYSECDPSGSTQRAVSTLKGVLHRYPNDHAAMILELVQGEGGYYTAPREFFIAVLSVLKEANVTVIVDEIQTFGRLSRLFAFQHFKLDDYVDIVTIGKITQVCATLFRSQFVPRPGLVSQTFTGASTAIVAGDYIIRSLINGDQFGENGLNMRLGTHFSDRMSALSARYPDRVSGGFGIGMMMAFTPFGGDATAVKSLSMDLFDLGLMGFTAGSSPMRMRFLPPLGATTLPILDTALDCIESVITRKGHEI
ncbi:aminotransferase class III-fold pyridoxal phosphate-dependent enzyme [bacterium]|nr:aminotransferase class III-fold pyridoxal phosphate-dependent enzyme [bacterium]